MVLSDLLSTNSDSKIKINITQKNFQTLQIECESCECDAMFDICDEGGRIVLKGHLESCSAEIPVDDLGQGYFTIFIIDGGTMINQVFYLD